jgi:hypothetical protein
MAAHVRGTPRRYQLTGAIVVLGVFTALYVSVIPIGDRTQSADAYLWIAVPFRDPDRVLVGRLMAADQPLVGAGRRPSVHDGWTCTGAGGCGGHPAWLAAGWGEAMLGELTEVRERPARWRFAVSCARAALSLPLPAGGPVLAISTGVVLAAVAGAYVGVGAALPELRVFGASFVAFLGLMMVLVIARTGRLRLSVSVATVVVVAAVAAGVALTATLLLQEPTAAEGLPPARAAFLALVLAGSLGLAVAPPRSLGGGRLAPYVGVGVAVVFASGLLLVSRAGREGGPAVWLALTPELIYLVAGFAVAAARRSFRAGLSAAVWTAIAVTPLAYAAGLADALRQHAVNGVWTFAGDSVSAGLNFVVAPLFLAAGLVIGFPFGIMGAITAVALRRRRPAADQAATDSLS